MDKTAKFPIFMDILAISKNTAPHWAYSNHFRIGLVMEGTLTLHAGSQTAFVHAGDGFFINTQVRHLFTTATNDPVLLYSVCFHPRIIGGSADSVYWQKYINPLSSNSSYPLQIFHKQETSDEESLQHILHVLRTLQYRIPGYELLVRNELSFVILDLIGRQSFEQNSISRKQLRNEERIHHMLQYIEQHYAEPISLQDLSSSISISVSECIRCFKDTLMMTPINYIRMFRLIKAEEQILHTNKTISEIAYDCGFPETSYFNRCFKKQYKQTPLQYRLHNQ
ncbi:MAG: AraC family transcriptional regulator [Bulleidia sp.]|nr:AraC family transcriptional regulator [Bulleidia sp.]